MCKILHILKKIFEISNFKKL